MTNTQLTDRAWQDWYFAALRQGYDYSGARRMAGVAEQWGRNNVEMTWQDAWDAALLADEAGACRHCGSGPDEGCESTCFSRRAP